MHHPFQVETGPTGLGRAVQEVERRQEAEEQGLVGRGQHLPGLPLRGRPLPVGQGHLGQQGALLHQVSTNKNKGKE